MLQYAIAARAGRACYATLVTEQGSSYEPVFSQLRPGIQVLPNPTLNALNHSEPPARRRRWLSSGPNPGRPLPGRRRAQRRRAREHPPQR